MGPRPTDPSFSPLPRADGRQSAHSPCVGWAATGDGRYRAHEPATPSKGPGLRAYLRSVHQAYRKRDMLTHFHELNMFFPRVFGTTVIDRFPPEGLGPRTFNVQVATQGTV